MHSTEYEALRKRRPDLKLPAWRHLNNTDRHKAKRLHADSLVARRTAVLLRRTDTSFEDRRRQIHPDSVTIMPDELLKRTAPM